jgi:hypothetical protein
VAQLNFGRESLRDALKRDTKLCRWRRTTKAQELKQLMNRAEQGAGGAVVNVLAYQADYVRATEELKMLERAARSKHCSTPENWSSNFAIH